MKLLLGVVAMLAVGCTTPNPKSCLDGTCTDPRYPFCDENGVIAENPKTCIAVECAPGEIIECRDDTAVRCNGTGTDYDLVQCALGCDLAGCRMCATSADCTDPTMAICEEATSTCRGCSADADCESQICNADGSCEATVNVVFASPDGIDGGMCALNMPCSVNRAYVVASGATNTKTVRMLPGTYTASISMALPNSSPVRIIGRDAVIEVSTGMVVTSGANVTLEGAVIRSALPAAGSTLRCGSANTNVARTTMSIRNVSITDTMVGQPLDVERCAMNVTESRIEGANYVVGVQSGSLVMDRSRLVGSAQGRGRLHTFEPATRFAC